MKIDFEITLSHGKIMPRFVNVIIILGDRITLIDTGVKGSERLIFDYIKKQKRDYSEIDRIILSHSHPDHIGSAAAIKELTNCRVLAHESEKEWIENIDIQNKQRPVPGFYGLVDRPVIIDDFVSDNQVLEIRDGINIKFINSPGHSKGSLNILFENDKILFTADSIPLKNDIPNYDDYVELMGSLEAIKRNPGFRTLLTSWTPPLSDRDEIDRLIVDGEEYMKRIDAVVKDCYRDENANTMDHCKNAVEKLGLPPFLVSPIVDRAFKSHLK
ncbi:MAG TPA: MBL fold metallo-hydrolase [Bacteroidales bacterium]|nr:MBL fold metallo-hydrolase [Bacteroidales bacterium]